MIAGQRISPQAVTMVLLPIGLACIVYYVMHSSMINFFTICLIPFFILLLILSIRKPAICIYILFVFNYFFMPWYRYSEGSGLSVWSDILWWMALIIIIINSVIYNNIPWKRAFNLLTIGGAIWAVYTAAEVANPSAVTEAWIFSRNLIYNTLLVSLLTVLLITSYKQVHRLLIMLSIFSLIAVIKTLIQRYIGFDDTEMTWLMESEAYKTHLLPQGIRYFSIFSDAGNFGSNMGFIATIYTIMAIFTRNRNLKIYYFFVALSSTYAMFMSGTRGAIFVPLGGLLLFSLISKNIKLMFFSGILGICIYIFFAHTYIGESHQMISRMRTAFRPSKDASFNVRMENQKQLAEYMKYKPFGEGLGLGGVEARKYAIRLTTQIPNDSTYVKIWTETGIIGIILYLGIYISSLVWGCYLIMFKIKNKELQGLLTAIACGIFGMMVSAYGNAFFTQFPSAILIIIFLAILQNGRYIDENLVKNKKNINSSIN